MLQLIQIEDSSYEMFHQTTRNINMSITIYLFNKRFTISIGDSRPPFVEINEHMPNVCIRHLDIETIAIINSDQIYYKET